MIRRGGRFVEIKLRGVISEGRDRVSSFLGRRGWSLRDLLDLLESISKESRIELIVLTIQDLTVGWAQVEEIHQQLARVHDRNKRTIAFLEHASHPLLYLASGCQKTYAAPATTVELVGLSSESYFFRDALDWLGMEPEFFRTGAYKTAVEPFERNRMSDAGRKMADSLLTDLQDRFIRSLARQRKIEPAQVNRWIENGPFTSPEALQEGILDGVCYLDELVRTLEQEEPRLRKLPLSKIRVGEGWIRRILRFRRPQIAYIVAEGIIVPGESRPGRGSVPMLGSESLIALLRRVRKKKRVRALVLRINSPGGSATASDLLWREVRIIDEEKPVIVTFGEVAASGGYYIAVAARQIFSQPSTITGSIGAVGGKINVGQLLRNLKVSADGVQKGPRAGYHSINRRFTEDESRVVEDLVRFFYEDLFLPKVAAGRKLTVEEVRKVAEGRVWTGAQAIRHRLVDGIGGIREAVQKAADEAGLSLPRARLVSFSPRRGLLDLLSIPGWPGVFGDRVLALLLDSWRIR